MNAQRWAEIQSTFDTLVEMDDVERGHRLTALTASDPELCAAVELLLAADSDADARLAPLEAVFFPQSAAATDPLGLAGQTVSHFEVHEPIGAGGMGVVYRADDTHLARPVALKFLLPSHSLDAGAKARFLREAHLVATLDHPNLCTIHEVGTSEDGRVFLAMALYPGETLKARMARDRPMSVGEILEIARQITEGLQCAHEAGIVHRDLKPGNVMLLPDGTVKILDFGLAKARDQSLSEPGARFGTVSYMSPEQIRGEAVDARADLWAVGVVLYEMLTDRKPFGGERDIAIAHAILHDAPAPVSRHRGDVSAALDDLVLRLLQKNKAKRYPAASELLSDLAQLDRIAAGNIESLRTRWRRLRRSPSAKRRRIMTAFGAMLVFGGAVEYATMTRKNDSNRVVANRVDANRVVGPRTSIAVLPFRNLDANTSPAYFANALHDEILTQLYTLPAVKVIGQASTMGYSGPDTMSVRRIASELAVGSVVKGSVGLVDGRWVRVNVQLIDVATDSEVWAKEYKVFLHEVFSAQADIVQKIVAAVGATVGNSQLQRLIRPPTAYGDTYRQYLLGREYITTGSNGVQEFDMAQLFLDKAIKYDSAFALARAARSELYGRRQILSSPPSPEDGLQQRKDAVAALRLAPDLPQAHFAMGMAYLVGDHRDAAAALREFMIALKGFPRSADVWLRIAEAHRSLGNWNQAVVAYDTAVELDPRNMYLHLFVGAPSYTYMRRYSDAVRAFDKAVFVAVSVRNVSTIGLNDTNRRAVAVEKAKVYVLWRGELGPLRSAVDRIARNDSQIVPFVEYAQLLLWERRTDSVLAVLKRTRSPFFTNSMLPVSLFAGWTHQLRGETPAARAAFNSAVAIEDTLLVIHKSTDRTGEMHAARGLALAGLGRRKEALRDARWLQESAPWRKDAVFDPLLREWRARIYAQLGDADRALDEIELLLAGPSLVSVHTLRLDPIWDPIRNHPRFRALLVKYAS